MVIRLSNIPQKSAESSLACFFSERREGGVWRRRDMMRKFLEPANINGDG